MRDLMGYRIANPSVRTVRVELDAELLSDWNRARVRDIITRYSVQLQEISQRQRVKRGTAPPLIDRSDDHLASNPGNRFNRVSALGDLQY